MELFNAMTEKEMSHVNGGVVFPFIAGVVALFIGLPTSLMLSVK